MEELSKRFRGDRVRAALRHDAFRQGGETRRDLTLSEALALVILVVFIFLQNWRTTLIPPSLFRFR